jgi:hypothetical protein
MSTLYVILGGIVVAQFLAPDGFNRFSDYLAPFYAIIVLAAIQYYRRQPPPKKIDRNYTLAKKEIPWQQKFVGTWDKTERPGFKEFAIFMGQNSFVAGMAEKQPFGNIIQFQDETRKVIKIDITGVPAQPGAWVEMGQDKPGTETKDPKGNPTIDKIWFNEEEKKLYRTLSAPPDAPTSWATDVVQIREITEDDKLVITATLTRRSDGKSGGFKAIFVRTDK